MPLGGALVINKAKPHNCQARVTSANARRLQEPTTAVDEPREQTSFRPKAKHKRVENRTHEKFKVYCSTGLSLKGNQQFSAMDWKSITAKEEMIEPVLDFKRAGSGENKQRSERENVLVY